MTATEPTRDLAYESWADAIDAATPPPPPESPCAEDCYRCSCCGCETVGAHSNTDGLCWYCRMKQAPRTCDLCEGVEDADDEATHTGLVQAPGMADDDRLRVCGRCVKAKVR